MPSNARRLFGFVATVSMFVAGGWLAEAASSDETLAAVQATKTGRVSSASSSSALGPLVVTIEGVRNRKGMVLVLAFDDKAAFDNAIAEQAVGYVELPAKPGNLVARFPGLKSGTFAVTAIHDENGNYTLDFNGLTPTEGYATSNSLGKLDSPGFDRAQVEAGPVNMKMHYLN